MRVQRCKTDPFRLVESEAKSEKTVWCGFDPPHQTGTGKILPDHRQKQRKIQLRSTFTQRFMFQFTSCTQKTRQHLLG